MKFIKRLFIVLFFLFISSRLNIKVYASENEELITEEGFVLEYNEDEESFNVKEYLESAKSVEIPNDFSGYPITSIGDFAFDGKYNI